MKRKSLPLFMSCFFVLSICSCMGKETRINTIEGKDIANIAYKNTQEKISQLASNDYLCFDISANTCFSSFVKTNSHSSNGAIVSYTTENSINKIDVVSKANIDLIGLRKENADLTNTAFYASAVVSEDYNRTYSDPFFDGISSNEQTINEVSLINLLETTKTETTVNDKTKERLYSRLYTQENANDFASNFLYVLDALSGVETSYQPNDDYLNLINQNSLTEIKENYNSFKQDEMTSQEFIDSLFTTFDTSNTLSSSVNDGLVYVLDNIKEINIDDYLEFTKVTEKRNTTLSVSLNYVDLKEILLQQYNKDYAECSDEKVKDVLSTIYSLLPEELTYTQNISINKNNFVTGTSFTFGAKGFVSKEVDSDPPLGALPRSYEYDFDLTVGFNFVVSNKKIEIPTITETK